MPIENTFKYVLHIFHNPQLKERTVTSETTAQQFGELQRSYDALLQMYGEKADEVQELQLDLVEAKEIYRGQLDELMQQLRAKAATQP